MVVRARPRSESSIQGAIIGWVRKQLGFRCDKLSSGSVFQNSGLPDFIVWLPAPLPARKMIRQTVTRSLASPLIIEFKKEGEEPTKLQQSTIDELRELGYEVLVISSVEEGKRAILRIIEQRLKR